MDDHGLDLGACKYLSSRRTLVEEVGILHSSNFLDAYLSKG